MLHIVRTTCCAYTTWGWYSNHYSRRSLRTNGYNCPWRKICTALIWEGVIYREGKLNSVKRFEIPPAGAPRGDDGGFECDKQLPSVVMCTPVISTLALPSTLLPAAHWKYGSRGGRPSQQSGDPLVPSIRRCLPRMDHNPCTVM